MAITEEEKEMVEEESKVGKHLSDLTTRRVIVLVFVMLFSAPLFQVNTWLEPPDSFDFGIKILAKLPL